MSRGLPKTISLNFSTMMVEVCAYGVSFRTRACLPVGRLIALVPQTSGGHSPLGPNGLYVGSPRRRTSGDFSLACSIANPDLLSSAERGARYGTRKSFGASALKGWECPPAQLGLPVCARRSAVRPLNCEPTHGIRSLSP